MTATSVPNISRREVGAALRTFRLTYAGNPRELNAINRASLNLEACVWAFDGAQLVIESATRTGLVRYHIQHDACDCPAAAQGRACWHRAAYRLLKKAADLAQQAQQSKSRRYTAEDAQRITADANAALFA